MKTLLAVAAVCAVLVAVAYSSPIESKEMDVNAILQKALQEVLLMESVVQSEEESSEEDTHSTRDQTQDVFAVEQFNNAELQGWFKKLFKKVKKVAKKAFKVGKTVYDLYKRGKNCAEVEDMPEALEEAVIEGFVANEKKLLLQSMQAKAAQTDEEYDDGDKLSVELQKFFASQQTPATKQSFWKNLIKRGISIGRNVYKGYKMKKTGSCVQVQDLSEQMEDAVAEAMIAEDPDTAEEAAFLQLFLE